MIDQYLHVENVITLSGWVYKGCFHIIHQPATGIWSDFALICHFSATKEEVHVFFQSLNENAAHLKILLNM